MSNQLNNDYDNELSWSDNPEDLPFESIEQSDEEGRKKVLANLIKTMSMVIIALALLIFVGIAWFTMNENVGTSGMGVKVAGQNFEISMLSGSSDGIFKDPYHIAVHEDEALYWGMTSTNNLINYNEPVEHEDPEPDDPGDQGIHPGKEGVISFIVTPMTDSVTLDFDFEIIGYQASYNDVNNTPDNDKDDELVMTALSDLPGGDGIAAQNLLNGHILLFEHRTGTAGNYVYSTPICSNAQMHRIMNRTITTQTQIDIYWVWPNTLSTIVDVRSAGITTVPFCQDNDSFGYDSYTAITNNVTTYPNYYLKGVTGTVSTSDIAIYYTSYGDMYDQGDNEIGMRVNYILIKLSVTEGTAGGSGS